MWVVLERLKISQQLIFNKTNHGRWLRFGECPLNGIAVKQRRTRSLWMPALDLRFYNPGVTNHDEVRGIKNTVNGRRFMRTFICGTLCIIVTALMTGCGSGMGTKPVASAATQAVGSQAWVMQSGGVNVLKLTAPTDAKCVARDGSLHFTAAPYEFEFWLVRGATTVDEATASVSSQIVEEFKDFKPEHTTDFTFAGSPAKELVGTGHEADDGDPGDADVMVFKVGDHVFVACNHGESLTPVGHQILDALVRTAQMP